MRDHAQTIIDAAIRSALPDAAVKRALADHAFAPGRVVLVSAGKAAWQMAACAAHLLGDRIDAYHALKSVDSLIFTGTNANDVSVLLIGG